MKLKEKWAEEYVGVPIDSIVEASAKSAWLAGFDFAKRQLRILNEDVMLHRRDKWAPEDIHDLGESLVRPKDEG